MRNDPISLATIPPADLAAIAGGEDGGWLQTVAYYIGYAVGATVAMAETQPPASYSYAKVGY